MSGMIEVVSTCFWTTSAGLLPSIDTNDNKGDSNKGLGRACSIALAEAGATIIALSRTQSDLDKLEKEIKKIKGKVIKVKCDVMNYKDLKDNLVKKYGKKAATSSKNVWIGLGFKENTTSDILLEEDDEED